MLRTFQAVLDQQGVLHFQEPLRLASDHQVLVTLLDDEPEADECETALLSEQSLARDWERPEEDTAWSHLQPAQ